MYQPLVSVICLCFNHEKYIEMAIRSVMEQTYDNIELIAVDDASTDGSQAILRGLGSQLGFKVLLNENNIGNCRSFNAAFRQSSGKYIIDLAADDVLLPDRIKAGVERLRTMGEDYGVHFCDVEMLDESGKSTGSHFKRGADGILSDDVAEGDLYALLLEKYYISPPSMMMSRAVLEALGGYDENLSYEDFDFWVRSARDYKYCFSDQVLVQKHILNDSLSSRQFLRKNPHSLSTAKVCEKAIHLNRSVEEDMALLRRIRYELRWALLTENWEAARLFIQLKKQLKSHGFRSWLEQFITTIRPPWYGFWAFIFKHFYSKK